jgi:hypothetical protein
VEAGAAAADAVDSDDGPVDENVDATDGDSSTASFVPPSRSALAGARHLDGGGTSSCDIPDEPQVPAATAPPTAGHISSFLLHICRRVANMDVDPALGAAAPADAADDTSRERKRNNASSVGLATKMMLPAAAPPWPRGR